MRKFLVKTITFVLCIFALWGCKQNTASVPVDTDIYTPAVEALTESGNVSMDVTIDKLMHTGSNTFRETGRKQVVFQNIGSADMRLSAKSAMQLGDFPIESEQTYISGELYLTVNNSNFYGSADSDTVVNQFPPMQLINPQLYSDVTSTTTKEEIIIQYANASAAESWITGQDYTLQSASATVTLDREHTLKQAKYHIVYSCGVFDFDISVSVEYSMRETEISQPDVSLYTPADDVLAPYYLEQSYAYLDQVKYLQAQLSENIYSEVDPLYCDRVITIERSGNEATIYTTLELTDDSRGGQTSSYKQTETFRDGNYSISTNDEAPVESSRVDSQDINLYCKTLLTSNILSPRFVTGVCSTHQDNTATYVYSAGEALAETVCQKVCQTIYNNPAFLDNLAESYDDYKVEYLLTVDKISGIPLSSGLEFSGTHMIAGIKYSITARYEQAYIFTAE